MDTDKKAKAKDDELDVGQDVRKRVGMNIESYMKLRGMTQQELADKAGINRSTLSSYLIYRRYPRPDVLESLAKCLDVSVGELTDNYQGKENERDALSDEAYTIGRIFDSLDWRGKEIVRSILDAELKCVRDTRTLNDNSILQTYGREEYVRRKTNGEL